jgi:hypothetical protein
MIAGSPGRISTVSARDHGTARREGPAASLPFLVSAGTYAVSAVLVGLVAGTYRASSRQEPGDPDAARARASVRAEPAEAG